MQERNKWERQSGSESVSGPVQYSPALRNQKQSFEDMLNKVRTQIEVECFPETQRGQAEEIVLIMAEVMKLPPHVAVRIGGTELPAELVAEVYQRITHEHVEEVMSNYTQILYEIKRVKTYLRTALYNVVFEQNARIENRVSVAMQWPAKKGQLWNGKS